ncbi:hypothetical protein JCM3765_001554 [Sporobolomyces pararoseus]
MLPRQGEQTPKEIEITSLKRAKQKLDDLLVDRDNEIRIVKEENVDLKKQLKEANYQASHEARQTSEAQELLRKKTDALNNLKIQKENAEGALLSSEATVKERDAEIKKLTYQLEVTSVRSATAANEKVAEEKAALEKRVHKLSMDLQKAQLELEKEKEIKSTVANGSTENKPLGAGSKIARPPSRSSIAPSDSSRSRFGFQPTAPTANSTAKSRNSISTTDSQPSSIRPPSALSNHPSIPGPSKLPARRPSLSIGPSSTGVVNTSSISPQQSAKIAQLENSLSSAQEAITYLSSDLAQAQSTIQNLESTLETTQTQFLKKKDELLRVENGLMALERSSKEEMEALKDKISEAREDVEIVKEEANEVREELEKKMDMLVKEAKKEKLELESRYEQLVKELTNLEEDLQRGEGEKEDLVRLLKESKERETEVQELLEDKEEECVELENELAFLEETHDGEMEKAKEKRRELEIEIAELTEVQLELQRQEVDIEGLEGNREELERLLENAQAECATLRSRVSQAETAQEEAQAAVVLQTETLKERESELMELRARLEGAREPICASSSPLEAQIAILEAELFKKESEIDSLKHRLSQFEGLAKDHQELVDDYDSLRSDYQSKVQELATISTQFDDLTSSHSATRQLAERHHSMAETLQETVDNLTAERDNLRSKSSSLSESFIALQSEVDNYRSLPARSHDDEDVRNLRAQLSKAGEEVSSLQARLEEFETGEWASSEVSKDLENRITALEAEVTRLTEEVDTERGATMTVELDLGLARKTLDEVKEQLENVEGMLESETKARQILQEEKLELEEQLADAGNDSFSSASQVQDLQQEVNQLHDQLDEVRANAEDESYAHMQEVTELQLRLRGQENEIEDLQRELSVLEALRHILGETEARVDSLGWDLKEAHSTAAEQRSLAAEKLEMLNKRFEKSEEECLRLRSELDETRHKLSDAQDALDQAQADLATSNVSIDKSSPVPPSPLAPAAPSPTSYFFGLSPGSDPSILVTRLREERDELRSRLDFARTEADFRVKSLQKRLEESEENKTRIVSLMEVDLLDKTTALEHECDTNARIEEALRLAKNEKVRIEEELELATKELKLATGKVDEFERRLQEAEKAREEHETERESAWALEGELAAATRSAETIQSRLDAANASNAELTSSLDSLRFDLRQAEAELDRQHAAAAESNARIRELEQALAAAREEEETRQNDALAEFATLCESLESDVSGLRSKIAQQTSVINAREQAISLLQLNLAVRVAIADEDDNLEEEEEGEGDRSLVEEDPSAGDRTIAVEPSSSPSHLADLEVRLSEELSLRLSLEEQVFKLQDQLETVRTQAQSYSSNVAILEEELEDARRLGAEQQKRTDEIQAALSSLQTEYDALATERDSLLQTVDSLERKLSAIESAHSGQSKDLDDLRSTVDGKHEELEQANNRIRSLEISLQELESSSTSSASVAQERIVSLEQQLASVEARLSQTLLDLTESNERAHLSQTSLDSLQERHSGLCSELQRLEESFEEQRLAVQAATDAQAEIGRLQQRLVEAEETSILHEQARRRISILEEQLSAAQESVSTSTGPSEEEVAQLSNQLESALREVDQLSSLVEQERAEKAVVAAEREEAVEAEKETGLKAKAAGDRSAKEIQTLRQLGRASQAEAEALSAEVAQLRAQVGQLEAHIEVISRNAQKDLEDLRIKKNQALEEVVSHLEKCEGQIRTLEESIAEKEARIEELEQNAQGQLEEIDEANDNLIEALKTQKRYEAQVERLKSKVVTLQRDLASAKSTPPAPVVESAPLSNKKRRAPAEFDPLPSASASPAPRAIVASRPTSLSLDKENSSTARTRPTSAPLTSKKVDTVVPLKPEHQPLQSRTALRKVDENSSPVVTEIKVQPAPSAATAKGGNAKLDELKAKLAAQKKRTRSGLNTAGTN